MSAIELRAVAKRFGATPVLIDVDLSVEPGSLTAILGASGSGKTTMMRLIAGFDGADAGTVSIGGRVVDDRRRVVAPQHRGVGYVPQDGALFPHLTVAANVGFGLPRRQRPQALALLERVGLGRLAHRYPHQLSGGEQQRVALARALAVRPSVVLLDEPFNALDATLRTELGREVAQILAQEATTTVLVTHDRAEALALADQIAVLDAGRIVALDDPRALYDRPADLRAATSIGEVNVLPATFEGDHARCALGTVPLARPASGSGAASGRGAHRALVVRPEQLSVAPATDHSASPGSAVQATVEEVYFHGHDALAYLRLANDERTRLLARIPGALTLTLGQRVWVGIRGTGCAVSDGAAVKPATGGIHLHPIHEAPSTSSGGDVARSINCVQIAKPEFPTIQSSGPPAVPRLAATVILLRRDRERLEILLVRRNPQARFMPGAWVFPGGSLGPEDGDAEDALRATAVRELHEETGITLAADQELVAYARWITPEAIAKRFDTWFFLALEPPGAEPLVDGSEVVEHRWAAPGDALAANAAGELALVFPTIKQLQALSAFASAEDLLAHARGAVVVPVQPRVVVSDGTPRVVLPGDPGYDD